MHGRVPDYHPTTLFHTVSKGLFSETRLLVLEYQRRIEEIDRETNSLWSAMSEEGISPTYSTLQPTLN